MKSEQRCLTAGCRLRDADEAPWPHMPSKSTPAAPRATWTRLSTALTPFARTTCPSRNADEAVKLTAYLFTNDQS